VQRKDGRWQILIRHTDAYGVRKRVTVTGRTAKETRHKADEVRATLKKELPARHTRQLVDQYAETWIETTLANSDRKTSTKTMYAAVARHHIIGSQLGATPMHRVRPSTVRGWLATLRRKGLSDSTRRAPTRSCALSSTPPSRTASLPTIPWPRSPARAWRSRRRNTSPPSR